MMKFVSVLIAALTLTACSRDESISKFVDTLAVPWQRSWVTPWSYPIPLAAKWSFRAA